MKYWRSDYGTCDYIPVGFVNHRLKKGVTLRLWTESEIQLVTVYFSFSVSEQVLIIDACDEFTGEIISSVEESFSVIESVSGLPCVPGKDLCWWLFQRSREKYPGCCVRFYSDRGYGIIPPEYQVCHIPDDIMETSVEYNKRVWG